MDDYFPLAIIASSGDELKNLPFRFNSYNPGFTQISPLELRCDMREEFPFQEVYNSIAAYRVFPFGRTDMLGNTMPGYIFIPREGMSPPQSNEDLSPHKKHNHHNVDHSRHFSLLAERGVKKVLLISRTKVLDEYTDLGSLILVEHSLRGPGYTMPHPIRGGHHFYEHPNYGDFSKKFREQVKHLAQADPPIKGFMTEGYHITVGGPIAFSAEDIERMRRYINETGVVVTKGRNIRAELDLAKQLHNMQAAAISVPIRRAPQKYNGDISNLTEEELRNLDMQEVQEAKTQEKKAVQSIMELVRRLIVHQLWGGDTYDPQEHYDALMQQNQYPCEKNVRLKHIS